MLEGLASGAIDLVVGTHAVINAPVVFSNLGLGVIDEQHRQGWPSMLIFPPCLLCLCRPMHSLMLYMPQAGMPCTLHRPPRMQPSPAQQHHIPCRFGVEQRSALAMKNSPPPHMLAMTATPIPRTLALVAHGDLAHSAIDEMPSGRIPVATSVRRNNKEQRRQVQSPLLTVMHVPALRSFPVSSSAFWATAWEMQRLLCRSLSQGHCWAVLLSACCAKCCLLYMP